MTDTPQWPATSDESEFVERRKTSPSINRDFFDDDLYEFPPLVFPRPLVDPALRDRDENDGCDT